LVVDSVLGCVGGLESLPALSSPDAILISCRIPLKDDVERFSRRELPGDFRGDFDLSIRRNCAFELDCLHPRIPQFIIALPGPERIALERVSPIHQADKSANWTTGGKLRRVFVWGSFVTAKPVPKDLDILLIMDDDFEVEGIPALAQAVFNSVRARLLFKSDVFWARASIGDEILQLWLETYQISRSFRKRGIVELVLP
jgi:uncharacterized protein DUF6932